MSYIWRHETLGIPLSPWMPTALHGWSTSTLFPSESLRFDSFNSLRLQQRRETSSQQAHGDTMDDTNSFLSDKGHLQSHVYVAHDAILQRSAAELLATAPALPAVHAASCRAGTGPRHRLRRVHTPRMGTALGTGRPQLSLG